MQMSKCLDATDCATVASSAVSAIVGGRSAVCSVPYMAALVASRHNRILRPLYLRLLTRGKAKKLALMRNSSSSPTSC
jgi:hypothetical protein